MNQENTPSGPERSLEELAKEEVDKRYPANEYYQTNLGRALVETTRVKFMEGFKAGFLAAAPKGKEEDTVEIIKGLKDIINYFGTTEEHRMYAVAQKILKTFEHTTD